MTDAVFKILLVDDDEDDAIIIKELLSEIQRIRFVVRWASTYEEGLDAVRANHHNAILVDYDLGARNGLDFIRKAIDMGVKAPLIMVTGRGRYEIDLEAMQAGAADYISKTELNPSFLERTIRYAVERRRVEEELEHRVAVRTLELQKTNDLLEKIFLNVHILVAYMDRDFNFIRVNRRYAESDGRLPEFYPGKNHFDLFPNAENQAIFQKVVDTGESYTTYARPFEYAANLERGVTYWDWSLQPVKDPDGSVTGLVMSLVDVTERLRAEQQITFQARLLENVNDAIYATDKAFNILYWNHAAEEIYGWSAAEALGQASFSLLKTDLIGSDRQSVIQTVEETGVFQGQAVQYRKDGQAIQVEYKLAGLKDPSGSVREYVGIFRDVTAQRKAEAALQESLTLFGGLFEAAPEAILLLREQGTIERANQQAQDLFGYASKELAGLQVEELIPARFREVHVQNRQVYNAHPKNRPMGSGLKLFARHKEGYEIPVDVTLSPLNIVGRTYVICIVIDLRRRA